MPLLAGARLGPYEIVSPVGAGGMGEVYRARDTRLGREVAIKVLPSALGSDPERLKRFEREARSASSLNHPNIVTIYDIGSENAVSYIAMELVSGEPLRALLTEAAVPVRRLLQIGTQVAEGLAKAHAAGIVHRDLKPENVMVTEDGLVKILDFGLAKLTQPDGSGATATMAPTVSGGTEEGIILGTVGYMSPEQATGAPIDYRSDQFSFGSILYEMAAGRRAFQRASAPQTLAAIIQEEPDAIATVNPGIPAPLRWTVQRCLAKQPKNRYASTEDLARELATIRDNLSEASSATGVFPAEPVPVPRYRWWIAASIAAVLLMAGVAGWRLRQRDYFWKNPLVGARYTRFTDWEGTETDAAISADGKFVAFVSDRAGAFDDWVGQVGGGEFLNLSKGEYPELRGGPVRNIGFSDDGAHVWFRLSKSAASGLSKLIGPTGVWFVPTIGGMSRPFLPNANEVAWSPSHQQIVYYQSVPGDPIFIADRNGGSPKQIFSEQPGLHNHYVTWSPDGRFIYFVRGLLPNDFEDIWRIPSAGGALERLTQHNSRVAYPTLLDDRTLVYSATREDGAGSGLWAMDVERRIAHPVSSGLEEYTSIAASEGGRRLVATVANPVRSLWTVPISDRIIGDSGVTRLNIPAVRASAPRFGPDYIVYRSSKGGADGLWKFQKDSETELWKGTDGAVAAAAAVSPDGTQICFVVRRNGKGRLYLMSSDGTNARPIAESLDVREAPSWSADGKWIAICADEPRAKPLFKVPVDGGAAVRLVDGVGAVVSNPVWSPDGRCILYSEGPGSASHRLRGVTPDKRPFPLPEMWLWYSGDRYRFTPNGRALIILQGTFTLRNFWLFDLDTGHLRQLTNLKPEFDMKSFDVSPDGKQILFDRTRENSDIVLIDLPPR